jgi:hypothetical protein
MPQTDQLPDHGSRLEGPPADDGRVRIIRPLSLTANVVLRPTGPLDGECADELRAAVDYVTAKPGGLVLVDCSAVLSVTTEGSSVLDWLKDGDHGERIVEVRNLPSPDRPGDAPTEVG